jgi:hypothetical protein
MDPDDEDTAVDPLVTQALELSTAIFELSKTYLKQSSGSERIDVLRDDLKTIRKQALAVNRAVFRYVKMANERENRLLVEIHLLRQAAHRDNIDRDANRARIYEYLRRYRVDDDRPGTSGATTTLLSVNPLHAPTLAATQVDRAMSNVARIEASIAQLSPTGTVQVHGAGLLTAGVR